MINNSNFSLCDIDCPKCRSVAKLLDYFLEDKEIVECPVCGYHSEINTLTNETKITYGYGVVHLEFLNKPLIHVSFNKPLSEADKNQYLKLFEDFYLVKEKSFFYLFDNETETITVLKGTNPQTFDKFIEDKINEMEYEKFLSSYRYLSQSDFEPF